MKVNLKCKSRKHQEKSNLKQLQQHIIKEQGDNFDICRERQRFYYLKKIANWMDNINQHISENFVKLFIGHKCDCEMAVQKAEG